MYQKVVYENVDWGMDRVVSGQGCAQKRRCEALWRIQNHHAIAINHHKQGRLWASNRNPIAINRNAGRFQFADIGLDCVSEGVCWDVSIWGG